MYNSHRIEFQFKIGVQNEYRWSVDSAISLHSSELSFE